MILRPDAPGVRALLYFFICDKMVRHWLLSPSAGEIIVILRPDAPGVRALLYFFICDKMVRHWLLSPSA
ncbi:hypothetical protein CQA48_30610, partial [Klebsiella pneumoniae]